MSIFHKRKKNQKTELRDLLEGYELPSFPVIVMDVLSMLRDPDSSITEIGQLIQKDPGMLVKVLRTVNAAAFGLATRVSNIQRAVTLLGRSRLETIVLSHAVRDTLPAPNTPPFNRRRFWIAAAKRANLARLLALQLHPATAVESFTAGLLQDMAVPVLVKVKQKKYCTILEHWNSDKKTWLHVLEQEVFSFDHPTIGGLMAEEWNLSEYLTNAIVRHHEAKENEGLELAIRLVAHVRESDRADGTDTIAKACQIKYGMTEDQVSKLMDKAFEDAGEFAKILK